MMKHPDGKRRERVHPESSDLQRKVGRATSWTSFPPHPVAMAALLADSTPTALAADFLPWPRTRQQVLRFRPAPRYRPARRALSNCSILL